MEILKKELQEIESKGLLRKLKLLEGAQEAKVIVEGKEVLNLCSNNYLGLANDARLKKAAQEAIKTYGIGSGASRLITGNMELHQQLEKKIAEFKGAQAALLFNTGYMANAGIISALMTRDDVIFSDKLNHASIVDGIILSRAEFKRYAHKDVKMLEKMLESSKGFKKKLIITDSIFSMDGDIAPLTEIADLAEKYDAWVFVDEAHATGVLGKNGRGAIEYFALEETLDIQMGTLSKAVGTFGAFVCGSRHFIDYLINKSRPFIYSTALPPAICASSIVALDIIKNEPQRRQRLLDNAEFMRTGLKNLGFDTLSSQTPIIPIVTKTIEKTVHFSRKLFDEGIFAQGIRPPTVPEGKSRLRVTATSEHSKQALQNALDIFRNIGKELEVI
ncbi:MAG: 8-amino-7-oxononanoate synthase [Elusimicrobia bacterium]|nr:8-amino-7-oxononanoate synthase [Elusimicrobiota bacterium]MBU2614869.1 8-amino-7-oxononanoate synthase [Elusimicrobiota bacterium]